MELNVTPFIYPNYMVYFHQLNITSLYPSTAWCQFMKMATQTQPYLSHPDLPHPDLPTLTYPILTYLALTHPSWPTLPWPCQVLPRPTHPTLIYLDPPLPPTLTWPTLPKPSHCDPEPDFEKLKCLHHFYTVIYDSNAKNCHYYWYKDYSHAHIWSINTK